MNTNIQPWSKSLLRYENLTPIAISDDSVYEEYERILAKYEYKTRHITGGKLAEHKPNAWSHRAGGRPMEWTLNLTERPISHFWIHATDCENMFPGCRCFPLLNLSAHTCTLTHEDTVMKVKEATHCSIAYGGYWFILVETPWGDEVWQMYRM